MQMNTNSLMNQPIIENLPDIAIRSIRRDDLILICEMHHRLSPESVYFRYLQYRIPTLDELTALCQLPPEKGAAFVATMREGAEKIIGVGYYMVEEGPLDIKPMAEIAILIEDRFQGQGIGRRLWLHLHHHAQAREIHSLRVLFDPLNRRVLRLIKGSGFPYRASADGDLNDFQVLLEQPTQPSFVHSLMEKFGLPFLRPISLIPVPRTVAPRIDANSPCINEAGGD